MKKMVFLLTIITSISCLGSDVFINGDFQYELLDGKTCVIKKYIGNSTHIVIPNDVQYSGQIWSIDWSLSSFELSGKSIQSVVIPTSMTTIGSSTFKDCTSLKTIHFLGNITIIENNAFENCAFEDFVIPNSVTQIGKGAFRGCKNLKKISIPASVQKIGTDIVGHRYAWEWALDGTSFDCDVNVSSDNLYFSSEDGILFNKDKSKLLYYPPMKKETKYQIPEYVRTIGNCAFSNSQLEEIIIPSSVTNIGDAAFSICEKLKSVSLPQIEKIPNRLLIHSGIESIIIPNSVKQIGEYVFYECKNLASVSMSSVESIGKCSFRECENLKNITFSNTLKVIGEQSFLECKSLTSLIIPNSVTTIGDMAFYGCTNLKKVIAPDKASLYRSFTGCSNLEEIRGYTILYPDYLNSGNYDYDSSSPFYQNVIKDFYNIKKTFSYYAYGKVNRVISDWQAKKEYETTEQWKERVTEANRQQKVNELLELARKEYIEMNTPTSFSGTLGNYDADYNTFPLKVGESQTLFINVPQTEAQMFKEKWNKVKASPVYGIVNDHVGILSCSFSLKGKTYNLSQTYNNDNSSNIALNLSPLELNFGGNQEQKKQNNVQQTVDIDHAIDQNIPTNTAKNDHTFAVIIGNERYTHVAQVPYANNDAKIFTEYCKKTLGIPIQNVRSYENVTFGTMLTALNDLKSIADAYRGDINVIFYYAGHGVPNEQTHDAFLLPVDADGKQTEACYPISRLYKELGTLEAKNVVVFMDACFSGAQRGEGMLALARGVALKAKAEAPQGNMVVFSAATGDETAYPYKEKGHGMFTYFLLKKLQESKGDCTLGELGEYIQQNVRQQSVVINRKTQTPTIVPSRALINSWQTMKLK